MTDQILFSLPGGAELIAKVVAHDANFIVVEHPLVIRPIQRQNGEYALDLFPHSLANPEGEHKFFRAQIVSQSVDVPEQLAKAYQERTSSIIIAQTLNEWEGKLN